MKKVMIRKDNTLLLHHFLHLCSHKLLHFLHLWESGSLHRDSWRFLELCVTKVP